MNGCVRSLRWTRDRPWMGLHELARGDHHRFLDGGLGNAEVRSAFEQAKATGLYRTVLRIDGRGDRAYAATNPMGYFAEDSEASYGTDDFYPNFRSELRRHDPGMSELLGKHGHEE